MKLLCLKKPNIKKSNKKRDSYSIEINATLMNKNVIFKHPSCLSGFLDLWGQLILFEVWIFRYVWKNRKSLVFLVTLNFCTLTVVLCTTVKPVHTRHFIVKNWNLKSTNVESNAEIPVILVTLTDLTSIFSLNIF